jgi:large subunit ribosomal protein L22
MLSGSRLKEICRERKMAVSQLAEHLAHGTMDRSKATKVLNNWCKGLYKPTPSSADAERLAGALGVPVSEISVWQASYRYAPMAARKARLVADMIAGRNVQDALDVLKFCPNRAAAMFEKVVKSAVANADEQEADVEKLYVCEARVDQAGRRLGTKQWIAKDRGRAHPIRKEASHLYVTVAEED